MRYRLLQIILFLFLFPAVATGVQPLMVISEDTPPYNFYQDRTFTGSSTEVVREILHRLHRPDDIRVLPWARGYRLALTRPNVVLFSTTRTQAREDLFYWVGPLCIVRYGFYARRDSDLGIHSMADARKVSAIATYRNDAKEQLLRARGFTNLDSSNCPASCLKKLMSGRVALWLFDNLGVPLVARQIGVDPQQVKQVLAFENYYLYIAISKGTPRTVVTRWQQALAVMKSDGSFEKISRRWLPAESIPGMQPTAAATGKATVELEIYTENSPPGNYLKEGKPAGFAVQIVQEILRRLHQPDDIRVVPWARGYSLALRRPDIVLFSTTRLPQREKLFKWVGPLYTQTWGFYGVRGTKLRIHSLADAKKVARIGTYARDAKEQFLQARNFHNLVSANKNVSNIKHLVRGDIDLWVSSDLNMPYQVRQAGLQPDKIMLVYPFKKVKNYIAFSIQTSDEWVRRWQQTLDAMKTDGTYARIRSDAGRRLADFTN